MLAHERKKGRIQTLVPHALMNRGAHFPPLAAGNASELEIDRFLTVEIPRGCPRGISNRGPHGRHDMH